MSLVRATRPRLFAAADSDAGRGAGSGGRRSAATLRSTRVGRHHGRVHLLPDTDRSRVQFIFLEYLPPDHFSKLNNTLAEHRFKNKSVVCNTYAAPVAWMLGTWGYCDRSFSPLTTLPTKGNLLEYNAVAYSWLGDARTNPEYRKPDYFVVLWYQRVEDVCTRILEKNRLAVPVGPDNGPDLAKLKGPDAKVSVELEAYEIDPYLRWAVFKLNWSRQQATADREYLDKYGNALPQGGSDHARRQGQSR